jgi:hypothetical protein
MKPFTFRPKQAFLLVRETVDLIEKAASRGARELCVSLDLGLSKTRVQLDGKRLLLPDGSALDLEPLSKLKPGDVYMVEGEKVVKLAFYAGGRYYRLLSVLPDHAPTLEISGIHMHRIKNITPWRDAFEKISLLRPLPGTRLLDIGTGLGYTAIMARQRGASVISVEIDPHVLEMARMNPWSKNLSDSGIELWLADALDFVPKLPEGHFRYIMHDPPRFALAGELYSKYFYGELFRVLSPGGRVYHYVGDPGKWRRKHLLAGVKKRLKEVGFRVVREAAAGVVAEKPRTTRRWG